MIAEFENEKGFDINCDLDFPVGYYKTITPIKTSIHLSGVMDENYPGMAKFDSFYFQNSLLWNLQNIKNLISETGFNQTLVLHVAGGLTLVPFFEQVSHLFLTQFMVDFPQIISLCGLIPNYAMFICSSNIQKTKDQIDNRKKFGVNNFINHCNLHELIKAAGCYPIYGNVMLINTKTIIL